MTDGVETIPGLFSRAGDKPAPEHLSQLLRRMAGHADDRITVRALAAELEDRSFGAFLFVFCLPNLVPLPPGATFLLGLPLIFVAWQMMMSRHHRVLLPRRIGDYAISRKTFEAIVERLLPWLERVERLVVPRFWFLETRLSERLIGAYALVLAVVVFLPIPLGNWFPALALAVVGFTHSERDGLGVIVGCVLGLAAIALAAFVVYTAGVLLFLVV
ncbi:exopolysaccharide biosynthesis protein [Rhizobium halophytocola]|uniref:Exopolysaccharide biosynthesis protein n=1 Tax=Rhizobium halophytocola TaxID=735519 RepID=A0ABS4DZV1_9HYPH|nr:exopolysaccharide biosynthesis protein [Rhizobium halophytocola]MBP1851215.1 hypothetical protein [Rhizobium halophytocola]